MHHNSIQGMVHETLTLWGSAREATYSAILRDRVSEDDWEATTRCLCSEADPAWKEMHEVMYNHQLQYDQWLATFLMEAEMALNDMQGEVWALSMLWQRMRASHSMLSWASCCKCSTCSRSFPWTFCSRHKYPSPLPTAQNLLFIEEAPRTGRYFTSPQGNQGIPHSVQSIRRVYPPTKQRWRSSHISCSRHRSCSHAPACSRRSGSVGSVASHHSVHSHATEDGKVSSSESKSSHDEVDGAAKDGDAEEDKGRIETSSDGQVASDGKEGQEHPHTQDTLAGISLQWKRGHRPRVRPRRENPVCLAKAAPKKP